MNEQTTHKQINECTQNTNQLFPVVPMEIVDLCMSIGTGVGTLSFEALAWTKTTPRHTLSRMTHSPSVRNLKDGGRDKFNRHYLWIFLQKYRDKLNGMGTIF